MNLFFRCFLLYLISNFVAFGSFAVQPTLSSNMPSMSPQSPISEAYGCYDKDNPITTAEAFALAISTERRILRNQLLGNEAETEVVVNYVLPQDLPRPLPIEEPREEFSSGDSSDSDSDEEFIDSPVSDEQRAQEAGGASFSLEPRYQTGSTSRAILPVFSLSELDESLELEGGLPVLNLDS